MKLVLEIRQAGIAPVRWEGERQDTFTIGRGNADISLDEPQCSRSHAILFVDPAGQLCVLDLDSTNGTLVDNINIDSARLDIGSCLTIGESKITIISFEPHDEVTSPYYIEDNGTKSITLFGWPKAMGELPKEKLDNFVDFFDSTDQKLNKRK